MSENALKREFSQRDINRIRNIITNNTNAATGIQTGYSKTYIEHKEGEVWEENGRQWTIKNGIKQTVSKLDKFKKLIVLPITCPKCNKPMIISHANKVMYSIHSMCLNCVIDMEAQLKLNGTFDEYQRKMMNLNKNQSIDDFEDAVQEWLTQQNETYVSEAGDIETWKGGKISAEQIKDIKEYIAKLREVNL
jgi:hypothetical protein